MQRWRRLHQRSKTIVRSASGFVRYRRMQWSCFTAAGTVASCASVASSALSTEAEDVQPQEVLRFWFGDDYNSNSYEMKKMWFQGGPETDDQIRARFGEAVEKLLDPGTGSNYLEDWEADRESALALIIMLDQFTRNSYRKQAKAFDGDSRALRVALDGLGKGWWHQSPGMQPAFALMPLEHSEDIAHHKIMREAFLTLDLVKHTGGEDSMLVAFLDKHTKLLEQFGRYPHRNEVLGRKSTPQEEDFLQGGGETFGQ